MSFPEVQDGGSLVWSLSICRSLSPPQRTHGGLHGHSGDRDSRPLLASASAAACEGARTAGFISRPRELGRARVKVLMEPCKGGALSLCRELWGSEGSPLTKCSQGTGCFFLVARAAGCSKQNSVFLDLGFIPRSRNRK